MAVIKEDSFLPEIWTWYGVATTWILLRFFVRIRSLGLRGLQLDDFFAFCVLISWTVSLVGVHLTYAPGTNVDYTAAEVELLTDDQIAAAMRASKIYLVTWYS